MNIFVYGTLREKKVFDQVVQQEGAFEDCWFARAKLKGARAYYVQGEVYPALKEEEDFLLEGDLLQIGDLRVWQLLMNYEDPTNYEVRHLTCLLEKEELKCAVFWPMAHMNLSSEPWSFQLWRKNHDLDAYIRSFSTS